VTHPTPRRRVVLLGATGSIGRQACDVIARFPDRFELIGAVAGSDGAGLAAIEMLVGTGSIRQSESVVLFNTGGALKYLDLIEGVHLH